MAKKATKETSVVNTSTGDEVAGKTKKQKAPTKKKVTMTTKSKKKATDGDEEMGQTVKCDIVAPIAPPCRGSCPVTKRIFVPSAMNKTRKASPTRFCSVME